MSVSHSTGSDTADEQAHEKEGAISYIAHAGSRLAQSRSARWLTAMKESQTMIANAHVDADSVRASIWQARGSDPLLDQMIAKAFQVEQSDYTSSVPAARALTERLMPNASLHVGFDALGILPVATLIGPNINVVETAATVPLAILRSLWVAGEQAAA